MAFSESFGFGSSTFDSLESQVKRAFDENERNTKKTNEMEVILESPKKENLTETRTRLFSNTTKSETNKRNWRKSKSDSKLLFNEVNGAFNNNENFTQFFQSDFAFSLEEQEELKAKVNATTKQQQELSQMRVSQLEAEYEDNNNSNNDEIDGGLMSAWEVPICSEDVASFMQTEEKVEEVSALDLQFSNSLELNSTLEKVLVTVEPAKTDKVVQEVKDVEDLPQLDASTFICPAEDDEAKTNLVAALEASKLELKEQHSFILMETSNCLRVTKRQECSKIPNSCERKNESIKQKNDHEHEKIPEVSTQYSSNENHKSSKHLSPTKDLESLKLISAWGLPSSVLAEYEKKSIIKMFDWQIECLGNPKVLFEHCNLVYSAPTSAGKTLVSEILLLKTVLERHKKVLMILPFISVVREKMFYLQDLLTPAGYRVEGFFGGYTPPGGFESINVAICTIEKANSIVNKLLEQNKLECIGTVVVDEVHLISDPGRGYILELLLAKILYMSRKYGLQIQVITMSATLANVELLKRWLDAELFITNYRPVALQEMIKVGTKIFDSNMTFLRDLSKPVNELEEAVPILQNDADNVAQLCLETVLEGCSVIVFCPSKDWCEKLSIQLAGIIHGLGKSGSDLGLRLRQQLKREAIDEVKRQLREIPTGLDAVLEKTITFGCAFHHAGLTTEERDIVEMSFKTGALKIIVATSTLSSGVNLPARRVLIRTPLFGGKQMNSLTYKQMIGRAGRTGKDTLGQSILICTEANARIGRDLVTAELKPITSCLDLDGSTHLKRALLEVISSGVANTKQDIELFVNCTLLSAQKMCSLEEKENSTETEEVFISGALAFLIEYEFVRLQKDAEKDAENYVATRLGLACLASSMPPSDGLILFTELQKSRRCFVLESELHAVYLVTPYSVCYQMQEMDWLFFLDLWEKLSPAMRKVGELVGVKESFLVRAMRGQTKLDYKMMQVHKRFYTALALQELVNETPINAVAQKYKCTRGLLQSLQQMSATFAGIVTAFCNALQWDTLSLIVSQFKERLFFGIHRDLIDLMRLPDLSHKRARAFFDAGITTLIELANADVLSIEKVLHNSLSFDLAKQHENENSFEAEQRNKVRNFYITGKAGLTVAEAAKFLISEARQFVEHEIGAVGSIKWTQEQHHHQLQQQPTTSNNVEDLHMSCEVENFSINVQKKRKSQELDSNETPSKQLKINNNSNELKGKTQQRKEATALETRKSEETKNQKVICSNTKKNNLNESKKQTSKQFSKGIESKNKLPEAQKNSESLFDEDFGIETHKKQIPTQKNASEKFEKKIVTQNAVSKIVRDTEATVSFSKIQQHKNNQSGISDAKNNNQLLISKEFNKVDAEPKTSLSDMKKHRYHLTKNIKEENVGNAVKHKNLPTSLATSSNGNKHRPETQKTFEVSSKTFTPSVAPNVETSNSKGISSPRSTKQTESSTIKITAPTTQKTTESPKAVNTNNTKKTTPKSAPKVNTIHQFQQQPRRSPRNHATKVTKNSNQTKSSPTKNNDIEDLFANEESFEMNSGIQAALAMTEAPKNQEKIETTSKKTTNPPSAVPTAIRSSPRDRPRRNPTLDVGAEQTKLFSPKTCSTVLTTTTTPPSDEIPSSQNMFDDDNLRTPGKPLRQTSRLLRSYRTQRLPSPLALNINQEADLIQKAKRTQVENEVPAQISTTNSSNSIDIDLSLESVEDSPYVMQMNASHILSCTKEDPSISASSFNAVEIIDICGNLELFKLSFQELFKAKRFGFCLGLQQLPNKQKPLIGANLLINQIQSNSKTVDESEMLFSINEKFFLAGIAFCISENIVLYMNLQTKECEEKISKTLKEKCLQKILQNPEVTLIIYETRKQLKLLKKAVPQLGDIKAQLEDPKVANWLLQPDQRLSLRHLAQQYAPECSALVNLAGGGRGDKSHGIDASSAISAKLRCSIEACVIVHILQGQNENLDRIGNGELRKFFQELEMPIQLSLCNMETIGFAANENALRDLFQKMLDASKQLETKIFSLHGKRFNLASAQAVGKVLGLCCKSNGRVSTSRQVLEKIDDPLAQLIITYRKLSVTMTKNIQPLLQCVQNNRVHGQSDSFTATGRISMKEPNLQNVAKDFEIDFGFEKVLISCRRAFFPTDSSRCLVSADFCQLEMRVLAHMSKDSELLKTMKSPNDVFTAIAAVWNNIDENDVSEQLRNGTKQICYGIIYGMGMRALAEALKCSEDEAKQVSEQFHEAYPAIRVFTHKIIDFARKNGFIETIQGRKRYLDNINSLQSNLKSQAERQAVNSAIQGSAADIAKRAILRAEKSILKYCPKLGLAPHDVQFVLHVHDELIFEVPTAKAKKIAKIISLTMESCTKLDVPLKVKLKMGRNWGEMNEINF